MVALVTRFNNFFFLAGYVIRRRIGDELWMMNWARNRHELFDVLPMHLRQITSLRPKPSYI